MCISSIFSWKLRIIPYFCEIDVRTLTSCLARRGGAEVAGWTLDRKIRVRFPAYPHRVWAFWWQGGKRRLRTSRCPCRGRLGTLKTPSCPWRGCPAAGQNLETGHLSRHYIAEISLNVTLNHNQQTNKPPVCPHKNLLNWNLVSKLVSTAAEWIVLSFDTPYYTIYPHILQTRRLKTGSYVLYTRSSSLTFWIEIQYIDMSWNNAGQVWIWFRSNNFWQSYAPWT